MIIELQGKRPFIAPDVYIAPTAVLIGDVAVGAGSSIWFGAILRGDSGQIVLGERVNVQDNAVIHVNGRSDTIIHDDVTIGHGVVLEGCDIQAGSLIGMNATVLSGAKVGRGAFVAAGAVVTEGQVIPADSLAAGVPARIIRQVDDVLRARLAHASSAYVKNGRIYQTHSQVVENGEA